MGDYSNLDDFAATMQQMQQQMQQTIQAHQQAAQQADKLTANVDQLLKNNQEKCFSMEEVTAGQIQNTQEVAPEAEKKENDQQGFPQNFQGKTFIFSQAQNWFVGQNQNQNQQKPQSNQQVVSAAGNGQPDELKGLGMMMQQLSEGAEERTEHLASSKVIVPDEPTKIPPVRVYVIKVPYPIPPRHLMDPFSAEQLAGYRKMVRRFPRKISFEHAWEIRQLHMFFKNCRETREEIKALFTEELTSSLKVLPKVVDPVKFSFPCSIAGVKFKEILCDSRSSVNLISKAIVDELGIVDVELSLVTMTFGNSSTTVPYGTICNLHVHVGDCMLHTEFQVVEMNKDQEMALIFGMSFMAIVGAIIDLANKRVSFSNFNKMVFYKYVPTRSQIRYASCIKVVSGEQLKIFSKKELDDNSRIEEVLDGDSHTDTKDLNGNAKLRRLLAPILIQYVSIAQMSSCPCILYVASSDFSGPRTHMRRQLRSLWAPAPTT
ncbi:hypothetical protein F2Q68_00010889 [Brassica cretica]|uniref:Aspartic peptidase DDI1-type domain-containing protein n=1 Tax=Brassica cretica TaxID=69181 RepID=A0A8S9KSH8_BRACR|nr:hypothetical protein F2Q68_00010889 [Brassica cretica]